MRIIWVCEPNESPMFHLGRDQDFVNEIGEYANVIVPLVEGALHEVAPPDGFILLNSFDPQQALAACGVERQAELASRVVPIDVSPSRIFDRVLEGLSVPAAVDHVSHARWKTSDHTKLGAYGPYGLREVGKLVGAECAAIHLVSGGLPAGTNESARYCYLHSPTHHGLPHLLADYLTALHTSRRRI